MYNFSQEKKQAFIFCWREFTSTSVSHVFQPYCDNLDNFQSMSVKKLYYHSYQKPVKANRKCKDIWDKSISLKSP